MLQTERDASAYKFIKVEDYFADYKNWQKLDTVVAHTFDAQTKILNLDFTKSDAAPCSMQIHFVLKDAFRVRFNPSKTQGDYSAQSTTSVQVGTDDELRIALNAEEPFEVRTSNRADNVVELTIWNIQAQQPSMKMAIDYAPFKMTVFGYDDRGQEFQVWQSADTGIYYTPNGDEDYSIIQVANKPPTARYFGFGEQGGKSLCKDTEQVTYFNFDNMRYRQVYNKGPLDEREPLYHSDPFFIEFNGVVDRNSVCGIFIDNPSQVSIDIGYLNSGRYMFGTRFGDLDYYFFLGEECADLVDAFTQVVGRSKLKPRYILGYHQGCYGYEHRADLEWTVQKHRDYQIPLDGLHVDVDVQHNYQTFTVDEERFPNPQEMFTNLRAQGVKCSTNITPIISNMDFNYKTFTEGLANQFFVADKRHDPTHPNAKQYQDFGVGTEYYYNFTDPEENFNSGKPYIGEVFYGQFQGKTLGTTGHYPDLGRPEVRRWWGKQYQHLFDLGLEFVWQDMTTPAIRSTRGDMRGFPFSLLVSDNFYDETPVLNPAIKVWNLYSFNLHRATYEGLNHLPGRENKRNFIIGRGSFAGMHRFAGLWTGDNSSTWDFLRMNVAQVLSLGMCGMSICGQDIGGFEAADEDEHWADPELLIRWTTAGAFLPWFRNHYMRKGKKYFQEPFMYEEWFNQHSGGQLPEPQSLYRAVLPVCKYYIELRYRLLQLFYDAMFENTLNGMPICRAMFLNDPQDKAIYNDKLEFLNNQFFVRKDLLIAPILEPQSELNGYGKREIYLPTGSDWYCFKDNKHPLSLPIEGGTTIRDFDAHLDTNSDHLPYILPIHVRAGAIIPTIELEQYVGERNQNGQANPITLNIYPGDRGEYTMYLDDGVSRSSAPQQDALFCGDSLANNEYRATRITHAYTSAKIREIKVERIHDNYTPKFENYFCVAILHDPSEVIGISGVLKSVKMDDRDLTLVPGTKDIAAADIDTWYYDRDRNITFLKTSDHLTSLSIVVEYF
jgi:alpha-glucosidase